MKAVPEFTRQELASQLDDLFDGRGLVGKDDIVRHLSRRHAPVAMTRIVEQRLPADLRIGELRPLWTYLSDVPLAG